MRVIIAALSILLLLGATPSPSPTASAPASGRAAAIELAQTRIDTMLRTGHADPAWFSSSFLSQIPASQVDSVIASIVSSLGPYQSVEFATTRFIAHFSKGNANVLIHLDADSKIDGLLFRPADGGSSSPL
jgi:hypothetical protein